MSALPVRSHNGKMKLCLIVPMDQNENGIEVSTKKRQLLLLTVRRFEGDKSGEGKAESNIQSDTLMLRLSLCKAQRLFCG